MPGAPIHTNKSPVVFSNKAWFIWGIAALFYGFQFLLRVSPGVLANDLMRDFQLDSWHLGLITGCYYYAYAALQLPAGTLLDRLKPRRMMTLAAILCGGGCLIFSSSSEIFLAAIGRTMIGAGSAFAFLSCLKLGTLWFPAKRLPLVVGLTLFLGTLGAISASSPLAWLAEAYGWRQSLWGISFVGFALAAAGWFLIQDYPCEIMKADHKEQLGELRWYDSILTVLSNPQCWLIAFYGGMMYIPLSGFADLWGAPYLISKYSITPTTAGFAIAVFYMGIGLGAPLFSFISRYFRAFRPSVQLSAFVSCILFFWILYGPHTSFTMTTFLLFAAGLALGGQFLGFSMTCEINPAYAGGTAGGFHNMMCMLSGVISQPLIGWILRQVWNGEFINDVPHYTLDNYELALGIVPACLFAAAVVPWLIREVYPSHPPIHLETQPVKTPQP